MTGRRRRTPQDDTPPQTLQRGASICGVIAITGIDSIGGDKSCSLLGGFGSQFWVKEWGYPPIGVYFADCPSAGHDMLCLDYRACESSSRAK